MQRILGMRIVNSLRQDTIRWRTIMVRPDNDTNARQESLADQSRMINGLLDGIAHRPVEDEASALLPAFGPPEIHRKGHIEDFERRRRQLNMKRQAFAAPGLLFEREEAGETLSRYKN